MIEDVKKFRQIAETLIEEGKQTQESIMNDLLKVSFVTIVKLLQEDIQTIRLRSSVLGKIQDFNRRFNTVLSYKGIKGAEPEDLIQSRIPLPDIEHKVLLPIPPPLTFWGFLDQAMKVIPDNVEITINIRKS